MSIDPTPPEDAIAYFVDRITVEQVDALRFRGRPDEFPGDRVFGGLVLAQASIAAARTVDADRHQHSVHAYFLRAGRARIPIDYVVQPARDGRSFSSRRVDAVQGDEPICEMMCSFTRPEEGIVHADPMPEVAPPEELEPFEWTPPPGIDVSKLPPWPFESRPVTPPDAVAKPDEDPVDIVWVKLRAPLPDDRLLHNAALAYQSDAGSFSAVTRRHGDFNHGPSASLDHALWLHRPFRWDGWLLSVTSSPVAYAARALSCRHIYSRDGLHVATMAQECVFRPPSPS